GAYALWYVERHQQEVLHLESQRAVLLAALQWAQADGDDALALRFVLGLTASTTHMLAMPDEAEHVIYLGIASAARLGDRHATARLLNRRGLFHYYRGTIHRARRSWEESLAVARGLSGSDATRWYPLNNLTLLALTSGEYDAARRLADWYVQVGGHTDESSSLEGALFTRASAARCRG